VIACWASSSLWAPPTRRRMRACSISRVSTAGSLPGSETVGTFAGRPRISAARSPGRTRGDTAMKGRCGFGEPHERERLARRHGVTALAAVQHDLPAAPLERGGEPIGAADGDAADLPAGLIQHALELRRMARGDVHEQGAD